MPLAVGAHARMHAITAQHSTAPQSMALSSARHTKHNKPRLLLKPLLLSLTAAACNILTSQLRPAGMQSDGCITHTIICHSSHICTYTIPAAAVGAHITVNAHYEPSCLLFQYSHSQMHACTRSCESVHAARFRFAVATRCNPKAAPCHRTLPASHAHSRSLLEHYMPKPYTLPLVCSNLGTK